MGKTLSELKSILTITGFYYVIIVSILWLPFSGFVLYLLEGNKNPAITDLFDALWWSIDTFTLVGYGEIAPTTTMGRILTGIMMFSGITFVCCFSATLSNYFQSRIKYKIAKSFSGLINNADQLTKEELYELEGWVKRVNKRIEKTETTKK